jgi:hypothetical protein
MDIGSPPHEIDIRGLRTEPTEGEIDVERFFLLDL